MTGDIESFIEDTLAQLVPVYRAYQSAIWEAATTGTPAANQRNREAQAALMRFWADPERFANAKRFHENGAASDPLSARQLKVIYLNAAENQQDDATIERLTQLEAEVRDQYYNFRAEVDGQRLSDNDLDRILGQGREAAQVRAAWEASKQVGAQVADRVRELARVRNAAARQHGFRDHFQRSLTLNEIDEDELLALFARLDEATLPAFERLKAEMDRVRAAHFGLAPADLRPWHYGDRFFQQPPDMGEVEMDALLADQDPVRLALATYDGLGLEVRDILARSDLYAREGKDQHAFCIDLDREGDVRTLNNLEANHRWNETLLHELGHAVYDKHVDPSLPWLLRAPPHLLSTEAIALMMGSLTYDREWLEQIAEVPSGEAARVAEAARAQERAWRLTFTRWCLVMTHFERALYADPERDLDTLWWDLVESYQRLTRPDGRRAPDWAAKIHIALYPVYYQNYELGFLITAQLQDRLRRHAGGIVGRRPAGDWLVERYFRPGASADWAAHVEHATGESLNPQYFVASLA